MRAFKDLTESEKLAVADIRTHSQIENSIIFNKWRQLTNERRKFGDVKKDLKSEFGEDLKLLK